MSNQYSADSDNLIQLRPATDNQSAPALSKPQPPRVGLSGFDQAAAATFVTGDTGELVEHVRQHAEALSGPASREVRARTLARAVARASLQLTNLEQMLGDCLARRDEAGVTMVDKLLRSTTARLTALLAELRREEEGPQRSVVVMARTDNVNITGMR
ncbi:hypothetical protein K8640_41445 [Myxococcus sp. XM-1-1-1]|uniref:hypothetical protein n=1 Tax=Myxococcus sp. XM-1-1-1 TaxID=2874602 RepID=UPI001CC0600C|nr:hypothetical protein [Myxococcus sp. XM-1-1-1]MBZ4414701.1 hypothetical protein [Myxococcus sp. XM-1-1-1]